MTLSTLDIDQNKEYFARLGFNYLKATLFCLLFGVIYEHFSHGVYSYAMIYAFAIPLVGGTLPFYAASLMSTVPIPDRKALMLYHCAIATLTVGSLIRGALEIFGTTNPLIAAYWIASGGLLVAALVTARRQRCSRRNRSDSH